LCDVDPAMPKKIRRVRTFTHTATKTQEKHLIQKAKQLYEDPFLLLPNTMENQSDKYFKKMRKQLQKIALVKEDSKKLEKLSQKKTFEGAVAGTLLLAHAEKAPYLGVVKLPTGDVVYAQRGHAKREYLVGVQHFDDPVLRLLLFRDMAQKKKLYFYSWDHQLLCTGQQPCPPNDFIRFVGNTLQLEQHQIIWTCPHVPAEKVKQKQPLKQWYLRIHWKSAQQMFALDKSCAKTRKNTVFAITKYILQPSVSTDFTVEVIGSLVENVDEQPDTMFLDEYYSGSLGDHELIMKNMEQQKQDLHESDQPVYILDGVSYGTNKSAFIDALDPSTEERKAMEVLLTKLDEPLIVSKTTANKILENHWKDYGDDIMQSFIEDEEMATKFSQLDETPSIILQLAHEFKKRQQILAKLPQYPTLPPLSKYADTIAKTYKTFGMKKALAEIKNHPETAKGKTLSYAFLLAVDKGKDVKWKYSKVEIEYATFLKEYAQSLLEATPKQYTKALQELITASGSSETIPQ